MSLNTRPIGNIGFVVSGLDEMVKSLGALERDIPVVRTAVLNEGARFLVNEAKRNVHRVSSDLYNSISVEPGSLSQDRVIVSAKTRYAQIENDRKGEKRQNPKSKPPYGPHNYFTRAVETLQKDFQTKIKLNFDKMFARHKTR